MTLVTSHWSANAVALAAVVVVAVVHMRGTAALATDARQRGEGVPGWLGREALVFYAGLLVVLLALVSPIGYWSTRYIWVRSVQDLLLANVAPALIVLGAPWLALRRGVQRQPTEPGRGPVSASASAPSSSAEARFADPGWARGPVLAVVAFNVVWIGWHIPLLYDAALQHPAVYAAEVVCYLGLGVVLWLQFIGSRPFTPVLTPLRRVVLVAATVTAGTVMGIALVFGYGLDYPAYLAFEHPLQNVVYDQQTGGAVLWVLMLPAYVTLGIALLVRWLNDEEAGALTAGFDRLLKPSKSAWPSRPGL